MDKDNDKSQIELSVPDPGAAIETYVPDPGEISALTAEDVKKETDSKLKDINYLIIGVVIILLVMVATLVIASFHFNSATYKEYSQKENLIEQIQKINQILIEQNVANQQIILRQQNQIYLHCKNSK